MVDESQESKEKEKKAFIIGPIGQPGSDERSRIDSYIQFVYRPILKTLGYSQVVASHEEPDPGSIMSQIVDHLVLDDLVICDLTKWNANVLYELGIRHSFHKRVMLISEEVKPPFDLGQDRVMIINKFPAGMIELNDILPEAIKTIGKGPIPDNPVSRYFGYLPYYKKSEEIISENEPWSFLIRKMHSLEDSVNNLQYSFDNSASSVAVATSKSYHSSKYLKEKQGVKVTGPYFIFRFHTTIEIFEKIQQEILKIPETTVHNISNVNEESFRIIIFSKILDDLSIGFLVNDIYKKYGIHLFFEDSSSHTLESLRTMED